MLGPVKRISSDERGVAVIEHAILICVGALVTVTLVGSGLSPKTALRSVAYMTAIGLGGIEERPTAPAGDHLSPAANVTNSRTNSMRGN